MAQTQKVRRRTRDDPEVRRAQILDEAIRIIGQRGYYGFTVQELAQRCGLTNGGLLYHFKTKEDLLVAVLKERDRREAATIMAIARPAAREAARSDSSLGAVRDLLRAIIMRPATQPELSRLHMALQSEAQDPIHPAHDYFRAREAMVLESFAGIVTPHVAEPYSTARQLFALMDGLTQQWLRADRAFDLMAEWDRAVASVLSRSRGDHR